jgi:predicted phosphodiesterase
MDRVAVITDIHANLPALEAVLEAIDRTEVDAVYCGGDLVGYGPHSNEVCRLRRVRLVHGSPRKVNEYLFEDKPARTFERIAAGADCDVLVFGHTHKPWLREYGGVLFVNCGSVGKPKDGDARAASRYWRSRASAWWRT